VTETRYHAYVFGRMLNGVGLCEDCDEVEANRMHRLHRPPVSDSSETLARELSAAIQSLIKIKLGHSHEPRPELDRAICRLDSVAEALAEMRDHPHSETLALIAEHRLTVIPFGSDWAAADTRNGALATFAGASGGTIEMLHYDHLGEGPTIGDAVRACVQRIKER
jgi:hypothetical protein